MTKSAQEIINKNGFLNSVFLLTDGEEAFIKLMELTGKQRKEVMEKSKDRVTLSDIERVKINVAKRIAHNKSMN